MLERRNEARELVDLDEEYMRDFSAALTTLEAWSSYVARRLPTRRLSDILFWACGCASKELPLVLLEVNDGGDDPVILSDDYCNRL